jgi:hypothetical protein
MLARIAMMEMTTSNSMRVNPRRKCVGGEDWFTGSTYRQQPSPSSGRKIKLTATSQLVSVVSWTAI